MEESPTRNPEIETGSLDFAPSARRRAPAPLPRRVLPPPTAVTRLPRKAFRPVSGPLRKVERKVSHGLSRWLYPRIPGIHWVYESILRRRLTVSEAEVAVRGLPAPLSGLRLLLLTDLHLGPFLSRNGVAEVLSRIARLRFDVILHGGDLATSRASDFSGCADLLGALRAPLGAYGVLGNHEHYTREAPRLAREIEAAGVRLVQNSSVIVERGGAALLLAGIDDFNAGQPDLDSALRGAPRDVPIVLLSHNPDVFFDAAERGVALVLSGHTHGGQIRIPGLPVLARMSRFRLDEGRYIFQETELVVSRGLGAVGLPVRVACPPEAVLLEIRRTED
jgi:hypothetical protein